MTRSTSLPTPSAPSAAFVKLVRHREEVGDAAIARAQDGRHLGVADVHAREAHVHFASAVGGEDRRAHRDRVARVGADDRVADLERAELLGVRLVALDADDRARSCPRAGAPRPRRGCRSCPRRRARARSTPASRAARPAAPRRRRRGRRARAARACRPASSRTEPHAKTIASPSTSICALARLTARTRSIRSGVSESDTSVATRSPGASIASSCLPGADLEHAARAASPPSRSRDCAACPGRGPSPRPRAPRQRPYRDVPRPLPSAGSSRRRRSASRPGGAARRRTDA